MDDYTTRKVRDCIYNIDDNLSAIKNESLGERMYSGYMLEKLRKIQTDVTCLISIFEGDETNE